MYVTIPVPFDKGLESSPGMFYGFGLRPLLNQKLDHVVSGPFVAVLSAVTCCVAFFVLFSTHSGKKELLGFSLREKRSWPHWLAVPLNSVSGLFGRAGQPCVLLSFSCLPLVLLLSFSVLPLSFSCPPLVLLLLAGSLLMVLPSHTFAGMDEAHCSNNNNNNKCSTISC